MRKLIFSLLLLLVAVVQAQEISLDTSYGTNGYTSFTSKTTDHRVYSKVLLDGSLLVSSSRYNTVTEKQESVLLKYTSQGTLDTNFASNGVYIINHNDDNGVEILLDSNENIYLFGNVFEQKMFKLLPSGVLDTSFANNGELVLYDNSTSYHPDYIALVNNNFIVGSSRSINNNEVTQLKQIDLNGNFINSFGTSGVIELEFILDGIHSIDNNFFITGQTEVLGVYKVIKYLPTATVDTSFGANGIIENSNTTVEEFKIKKINNSYYLSFFYEDSISSEIFNYTLNGTLNTAFGNNGRLTFANTYLSDFEIKNTSLYFLSFSIPNFIASVGSYNFSGILNNEFATNGVFSVSVVGGYKDVAMNLHVNNSELYIVGSKRFTETNIEHYTSKYIISEATASVTKQVKSQIYFANPVANSINIKTNTLNKVEKIKIYSLEGKLLNSSNTSKIKTNNLTKGIYLLNCHLENGKIISKKIIKQ